MALEAELGAMLRIYEDSQVQLNVDFSLWSCLEGDLGSLSPWRGHKIWLVLLGDGVEGSYTWTMSP